MGPEAAKALRSMLPTVERGLGQVAKTSESLATKISTTVPSAIARNMPKVQGSTVKAVVEKTAGKQLITNSARASEITQPKTLQLAEGLKPSVVDEIGRLMAQRKPFDVVKSNGDTIGEDTLVKNACKIYLFNERKSLY